MASWPTGVGQRRLDIVDSTNAEGRRVVDKLEGPTWIMARMQTKGRGRRNRPWSMTLGNFAASLVMTIPGKDQHGAASLRTYSAALALRDACIEICGRESQFQLKWPNDLLLNRGKLAGILLECSERQTDLVLIIGFGVNLASSPTIIQQESDEGRRCPLAVNLIGETGILTNPEDFLTILANTFQIREKQLQNNGFASIRSDWLKYASGIGEQVRIDNGTETIRGRFEGLDDAGRAILISEGQRRYLPAGDMELESEDGHHATDD